MSIHPGTGNWGQGPRDLSRRGQDAGKSSRYRPCLLLPPSSGLEGELEFSRKTWDSAKVGKLAGAEELLLAGLAPSPSLSPLSTPALRDT